ncbi:hypothetical protein [Halopiger thermotolerans]
MSHRRLNRRTFVAAAGTTSALVLAGCTDGGGNGANGTDGGNETEDGTGNETDLGDGNETEDNETGNETDTETYALTVTVEDDQGEPVEGATVTVEGDGAGGMMDDGMGNETAGNATDSNETDGNETDDNETGLNETAGNATDSNETDGNETAGNETDGMAGGTDQTWEEETGENGEAEFENLENGDYTVTAEHEGQQTEDEVTIDGSDEELTLTLGEGATGGAGGNETDGNMTDGNESEENTTEM